MKDKEKRYEEKAGVNFPLKVYVHDLLISLQCTEECDESEYTLDNDEINTAIYALLKQKPKEVKVIPKTKHRGAYYHCRGCGAEILDVVWSYCPRCGQMIKRGFWKKNNDFIKVEIDEDE